MCYCLQAGRLLIRKVITDQLKIPWNDIQLARTDKGKPYLSLDTDLYDPPTYPNFNFNASHQGSFAVLAAEADRICGVDVMGVERPGG